MSNGIAHNNLNDISKIYLDTISDINKKDQDADVERWQNEAVKGEDTQRRKDDAAERRAGKYPLKSKKAGESYAQWAMRRHPKAVDEEVVVEKDLNASERRALPNKDFVFPGKGEGPEGKQRGAYPIPDKKHARNALAMAAAHASPAKQAKVKAAVKKKFPGIKVSEDKAFDSVVGALRKKHGKDAVLTKDSPKPKVDQQKVAAERKKRQDADNKAFAGRAKKAGYKNPQDYANVVAQYGSEDNMKKGKGLGT